MTERENTDRDALKPCPFCGGDKVSHGFINAGIIMGNCECHGCNVVVWAETEAEAIAAWNTRPADRDALIAELVEALEAHEAHMTQMQEAVVAGFTTHKHGGDKWLANALIYLTDGPEQRKVQSRAKAVLAKASHIQKGGA